MRRFTGWISSIAAVGITAIAAGVLVILSVSSSSCGGNDQNAPNVCGYVSPPNNKIRKESPADGIDWGAQGGHPPMSQNVRQTTPLGQTIYSQSGVSTARLAEADAAYTAEVARARAEGGYTNFPAPNTFDIFVPISCGLSPIQRAPSFKVKASADWDTNEFDVHHTYVYKVPEQDWQDGPPCRLLRTRYSEGDGRAVIWAAEMVLALTSHPSNFPFRNQMAVCDSEIFREAVANGDQHAIIAHNNTPWFDATLFAQHVHPLPYQPAATAFSPAAAAFDFDKAVEKMLPAVATK